MACSGAGSPDVGRHGPGGIISGVAADAEVRAQIVAGEGGRTRGTGRGRPADREGVLIVVPRAAVTVGA